MPTMLAVAPRSPWTERCSLEAWNLAPPSSFVNGPSSDARRSWTTGNARGRTCPCWSSRPSRKMASVSENYQPVVSGVAVVGDHVLRILFSDGLVGDVDFSAEHWTGVLEPLNDPVYLAQATVDTEAGTLVWPNGIDLAPEPLYEQARAHPLAAA